MWDCKGITFGPKWSLLVGTSPNGRPPFTDLVVDEKFYSDFSGLSTKQKQKLSGEHTENRTFVYP